MVHGTGYRVRGILCVVIFADNLFFAEKYLQRNLKHPTVYCCVTTGTRIQY